MVEMKVFGLALDEDSQVPVLILKDHDEKNVLPIWIGAMEAMAISLAINGVDLPRPMTHDLLLNAMEALGGHLTGVDVVDLREGTYYAELEVELGGEFVRIDCRPSDAVALALRADAPIAVSQDVLEAVAQGKQPHTGKVVMSEDSDKWSELLEQMDPDDIKYKM